MVELVYHLTTISQIWVGLATPVDSRQHLQSYTRQYCPLLHSFRLATLRLGKHSGGESEIVSCRTSYSGLDIAARSVEWLILLELGRSLETDERDGRCSVSLSCKRMAIVGREKEELEREPSTPDAFRHTRSRRRHIPGYVPTKITAFFADFPGCTSA